MRIVHVITGLDTGGAETMLHKIVGATRSEARHAVISLASIGPVGQRLVADGVDVHALGMSPGRISLRGVLDLAGKIQTLKPDVVQTWMYHANLATAVVKLLARRSWTLNWSVRCTVDPMKSEKLLTRLVMRAGGYLSGLPNAIVYNSSRSRKEHEALGYRRDRSKVIANGFDIAKFSPSPSVRTEMRAALKVADGDILVGHIARLDPMKDQLNFLKAAAKVSERVRNAKFLLAGRGVPSLASEPREARSLITQLGDKVMLRDETANIVDVFRALDVCALSSAYGEAFPNVLGEAMACGVPCVATDVGDCQLILGDTGRIVPPRDSAALAQALEESISMSRDERREIGIEARARVHEQFSLDLCKRQFLDVWRSTRGAH
ncbi:MAG: glycosyltransferase [Alphaproteobacteria bacterium]|nr:glycosyltransferase [Alphaproteobacteria bacterium]